MIEGQVKSELKQLPVMLGKLLGGIVAVIGVTMAVVTSTRKVDPMFADILPSLVLGGAGITIFALLSRLSSTCLSVNTTETRMPDDGGRTIMVSWGLLLLFVVVFLLCTCLMIR
jgi:hypothetical protein